MAGAERASEWNSNSAALSRALYGGAYSRDSDFGRAAEPTDDHEGDERDKGQQDVHRGCSWLDFNLPSPPLNPEGSLADAE